MGSGKRKKKFTTFALRTLILTSLICTSVQPTPIMAMEATKQWATSDHTKDAVFSFANATLLQGKGFWDWLTDSVSDLTKTDEEKKAESLEDSVLPVKEKAPTGKKLTTPKKGNELVDQRTSSTKFYELSDGRVQAEVSSHPIHYQDSKGKYQEIDPTILSTSESGFSHKNEKNIFKTYFGKQADKLVKMQLDQHQLQFGVESKSNDVSVTSAGNTVTYKGLLSEGDLKYSLSSKGLKEEVILKEAPTDATYIFKVQMGGVDAKQEKDGTISFISKSDGRKLFVMPKPFMMDSQEDMNSPYGKIWSDQVTQTVEQKGAHTYITLKADMNWLKDSKRKYPVTIDPTVEIQPTPTQSKDAMILNGTDASNNFNNSWRLSVGTTSSQIAHSLLKFDLSSIPKGTLIDSARVDLYYDQYFATNANNVPIDLHQVTTDWDPVTVTWNQAKTGSAWTTAGGDYNQTREYNEEIVDNTDSGKTSFVGSWPYSSNVSGYYGSNYQPNAAGTGADSFTWVPNLTESGTYQVEVRHTSYQDRATNAPFTIYHAGGFTTKTVNQELNNGTWVPIGSYQFNAGTSHKVVLTDHADQYVIADAVRFTKFATDTKVANKTNSWNRFSMRHLAQGWINGTTANYGVLLKASTEALGQGGPRYTASFSQDEAAITPKLVIVYGKPSVKLQEPNKMYGTGAELTWSGYDNTNNDFVEYQIHRSVYQNFTPSASTLIAPLSNASTTQFTDTTATPTSADNTDIKSGNAYYYAIVVKTKDGKLTRSNTALVRLPKAGIVKRIIQGSTADTILSNANTTTNYSTDSQLTVGTGSITTTGGNLGKTRAVLKFDTSSIPTNANVVRAEMQLWGWESYNTPSYIDAHPLTQTFTESQANWNQASSGVNWTTAGGDYSSTALDYISNPTNDPKWSWWLVSNEVQKWVKNAADNYGILIKKRDETTTGSNFMRFLSSSAEEPELRPRVVVYYTDTPDVGTYYAPYTPTRMVPNNNYTVDVTLTNTTSGTWKAADYVLSYHWAYSDGTEVTNGGQPLETEFKPVDSSGNVATTPVDVAPGQTITVRAQVKTPINSDNGNKREAFTLQWDLKNRTTGTWLSPSVPRMDQEVILEDPKSGPLGMEKFYQYAGKNTGSGSTAMINNANGNTIFSYNPLANPSRGLSTFVRLTYNSLDTSDSVLGYGWSLSTSSIMRLGTPLDLHPLKIDKITGAIQSGKATLTDGDGTTHEFEYDSTNKMFKEPSGVHLYLQLFDANGTDRKWVMTKPDRTQFFFDQEGFMTAIRDKNGNELTFTYEERKSNNKPTKFLRYITDISERRTLSIDYYAKGDAGAGNNPKIIDKVKSIKDISDRTITFTYDDKGLLTKYIDGAGAGTNLEKVFEFTYDSTQGNKNTKLISIKDPRGNSTAFTYFDATTDPKNKWKVQTMKDRMNGEMKFGYEVNTLNPSYTDATVTDALNRKTTYLIDDFGKPLQIINAKNEVTKMAWDADFNVTRLEEANGATTTWVYDNNGLPLTITDAENNAKTEAERKSLNLEYQYNLADPLGKKHTAELVKKTSPEGRMHAFSYDSQGNLLSVTDPKGNATITDGDYTTTYTYHGTSGLLKTITDANGHVTTYGDSAIADFGYDENGYPKLTKNALEYTTETTYGLRGEVLTVTDAKKKTSTYRYDVFGRPLTTIVPKDQTNGKYIETPAPLYDKNDNVIEQSAPNGAKTTYVYDAADAMTSSNMPKDTDTSSERKAMYEYDIVGNLKKQTEPKGSLTTTNLNDFVTLYEYDVLDQMISASNSKNEKISYTYDNVGNMVKMIEPKGNTTTDIADDYATAYTYDKNHRVIKVTDAAGKSTETTYDNDSNKLTTTDKEGNTTYFVYDERSSLVEVKAPHKKNSDGSVQYNKTQLVYDEAGNQTKVITPRGVETSTVDDFTQEKVYDELNRVKEVIYPRDLSNPKYSAINKITYTFDEVGNVTKVSAPPSVGQSTRNDTVSTYFDNGWVKNSIDAWDIVTEYDYNELGKQTSRTIKGEGGTNPRTLNWNYYPDGKLKDKSDSGEPAGAQVVISDNTDTNNAIATGTWTEVTTGSTFHGSNYVTHASGTSTDKFTWNLPTTVSGSYKVYAKIVADAANASDAVYTITYDGGIATKQVDQKNNDGQWVLLGTFNLKEGQGKVELAPSANGKVIADAVKIEKDLTGVTDNEKKDFTYSYDVNGNLVQMTDNSPSAKVKSYSITYTEQNQVSKVEEKDASGTAKRTITFTYDENGNPLNRSHDDEIADFEYDIRNLLTKLTQKKSITDSNPKVTSYEYTPNGLVSKETLPNGNITTSNHYLDGQINVQETKKSNGTLVNKHTLEYNSNGHKIKDTAQLLDANGANKNNVTTYQYDPMDRIVSSSKTGDQTKAETYEHDANNNVIKQVIDGTTTTFSYDRNRLVSMTTGGASAKYNYDVYGRLRSMVADGIVLESYKYDGFDHVQEHKKIKEGTTDQYDVSRYEYDPLDRTTQKTEKANSTSEKTTEFSYLGLGNDVISESIAGEIQKSYQYSPWGKRLSMAKKNDNGSEETSYYGYNTRTDVEMLFDENGGVKATYGYTAYGNDDEDSFTGVDKPDPAQPDQEAYNVYRYSAKRWDPSTKSYDMGFRDYAPGMNQFLSRDMYNGALSDMNLAIDPWTNNRYAFAGGNPVSNVELDGHFFGFIGELIDSMVASIVGNDRSRRDSDLPSGSSTGSSYTVGDPKQPDMSFDNFFPYDPNAEASFSDYMSWAKWGAILTGAQIAGHLPEGTDTYAHYRDGTGTDYHVNYDEAYFEDETIQQQVDSEILSAKAWAEKLYKETGQNEFNMTGSKTDVPNGTSENWQKAIGAHHIWGSANVQIEGNQITMRVTIHAVDKYNFNADAKDIRSGAPDNANGRFEQLGWAKSFMTYGELSRQYTWTIGQ